MMARSGHPQANCWSRDHVKVLSPLGRNVLCCWLARAFELTPAPAFRSGSISAPEVNRRTLLSSAPTEPFASLSRERSYRTRGFACRRRRSPIAQSLLSRIVGDTVAVARPPGIAVNGTAASEHQSAMTLG